MEEYKGVSVGGSGKASGSVYMFPRKQHPLRRYHIEDSAAEIERFEKAREEARREVEDLFLKTCKNAGEEAALVFSSQIDILENDMFIDKAYDIITDQTVNAEIAAAQVCDEFAGETELSENDYMGNFALEMRDVGERIIRILLGIQFSENETNEYVIIAAKELHAGDIMRFNADRILGIVLDGGEDSDYAKQFALKHNIPMIINIKDITAVLKEGNKAVLDGKTGEVTVN